MTFIRGLYHMLPHAEELEARGHFRMLNKRSPLVVRSHRDGHRKFGLDVNVHIAAVFRRMVYASCVVIRGIELCHFIAGANPVKNPLLRGCLRRDRQQNSPKPAPLSHSSP